MITNINTFKVLTKLKSITYKLNENANLQLDQTFLPTSNQTSYDVAGIIDDIMSHLGLDNEDENEYQKIFNLLTPEFCQNFVDAVAEYESDSIDYDKFDSAFSEFLDEQISELGLSNDDNDNDDMYSNTNESKKDISDSDIEKITKAIIKTIKTKMGNKITKEMDLKDMTLDYMGAKGFGEDKKIASEVVKKVKAHYKAIKESNINENDINSSDIFQDIINQNGEDVTAEELAIYCYDNYDKITGRDLYDRDEEGHFPEEFHDLMDYFNVDEEHFQEEWNYYAN